MLERVEQDVFNSIKNIKESGPKIDYRPDGILIPLRVEYIETLLKDLVTNCNFPLEPVKEEYENLQEVKKLEITGKVQSFITKTWKEAIYHQNRWDLDDETKGYNTDSVKEGMELVGLSYNTLMPWFHHNYGLDF